MPGVLGHCLELRQQQRAGRGRAGRLQEVTPIGLAGHGPVSRDIGVDVHFHISDSK